MLHISICTKDAPAAEKIENLVTEEAKWQQIPCVTAKYDNGEEFLKQYRVRDNELIFLDIDLPGGTGIDVAKELEKVHRNKHVILMTDSDQLLLESLSYCPFQLLRKSDMERDIPIGFKKYQERQKKNVLELSIGKKILHIKKMDMVYAEKWRNYVMIHTKDKKEWKVRGSIRQLEMQLLGDSFVKVHAGCIVNMDYCQAIEKSEALLMDGTRIPISRNRNKFVRDQFIINRKL